MIPEYPGRCNSECAKGGGCMVCFHEANNDPVPDWAMKQCREVQANDARDYANFLKGFEASKENYTDALSAWKDLTLRGLEKL